MFSKYSKNFSRGVIIGTVVCLLYWYWQKSTKAENGALALLERLKQAEARLQQAYRTIGAQTAVSSSIEADDLTQVKGIGPVFAERLQKAGVQTFKQLAELDRDRLATVLDISSSRAEKILSEVP